MRKIAKKRSVCLRAKRIMRNLVIMTDQLEIDAMNKAAMMASPEKLVSWKAKISPPEARKPGKGITQHIRSRRQAGKIAGCLVAFFLAAPAGRGAEGEIYDVFAKALAPVASSVFGGAAGQPGAMVAECSVGEATGRLAAARGMKQVTDTGAIEAAVDEIIAANPVQVEKARANPKLAGWFTGQVIKATGGKANPATVGAMVAAKLGL